MNKEKLISVGKGAAIAIIGMLLTYLTQYVSNTDLGSMTPLVVACFSVLVNALRKYIEPESTPDEIDEMLDAGNVITARKQDGRVVIKIDDVDEGN